ncbi:GerMN domain-containing protein [Desulfosporosinus sp. BG]|uniref:GerMN domain-containing protein n=1 Tax=Desulfosporosinus sp. BG TaxID=1633135 RepID=UPI00083A92EA|nr:GerMN domain-containing protein [Desulfosporosinus sp. BG]ODA42555.1 Spore germination protein [Desulfosporosinus sp. BG]
MSRRTFKTLSIAIVSLLLIGTFLISYNFSKTQAPKPSDNTPTPSSGITPTPPQENNSSETTPHSVTLTLYFPNSDASGLISTARTVELADEDVIKAMFTELANPPSGLQKPLPKGTTLLNASVKDNVATIDLSSEFKKNFGGGSAGEEMTIYSIVNTLTTLPNVHSVQFLLDGKKLDGILGNLDTSVPLQRNDGLITKTN